MDSTDMLNKSFTVVLAPWGDPFGWGKAKYRIRADNGTSLTSKTSLIPLIEEFDPDLVMVMIPETLSCLSPRSSKEYDNYVESIQGPKTIVDVFGAGDLPEEYRKLLDNLRRAVTNYIEEAVNETNSTKPVVSVDVAPNTGTYSCSSVSIEWRFPDVPSISPDGAYFSYFLASALHHILSQLAEGEYGRIDMVLDTTHGMNYTVAAAIEAATLAARMVSIIEGMTVTFKQFNSTSFPRGTKQPVPELDIYPVKEEVIVPIKAAQRLVYSYCAVSDLYNIITGDSSERRALLKDTRLESDFKRVYSVAAPLVASVHYSLPLAFLQFSYDANEGMEKKPEKFELYGLVDYLYKLLGEILYKVVSPNDDKAGHHIIKHQLIPDHRKVKGLLSAFAFIKHGKRALQDLMLNKSCDGSRGQGTYSHSELGSAGGNCTVEASIRDLHIVLENYVRGPMIFVAQHELSQIMASLSSKVKDHENHGGKYWDELIEKAREDGGKWVSMGECEQINPRNFIAHIGISGSLVEINVEKRETEDTERKLLFRYRQKCKRSIRRIAGGQPIEEIRRLISLSH